MSEFKDDNWMEHCVETLRQGWRGRLRLLAPEEQETPDYEELFGTVTSELEADIDPDDGRMIDATFRFQTNYSNGQFLPLSDQPGIDIRVSRLAGIEEL